jgi:hypothetical protein
VVVMLVLLLQCLLVDGLRAFLQTSTPPVVMIPHLMTPTSGAPIRRFWPTAPTQ